MSTSGASPSLLVHSSSSKLHIRRPNAIFVESNSESKSGMVSPMSKQSNSVVHSLRLLQSGHSTPGETKEVSTLFSVVPTLNTHTLKRPSASRLALGDKRGRSPTVAQRSPIERSSFLSRLQPDPLPRNGSRPAPRRRTDETAKAGGNTHSTPRAAPVVPRESARPPAGRTATEVTSLSSPAASRLPPIGQSTSNVSVTISPTVRNLRGRRERTLAALRRTSLPSSVSPSRGGDLADKSFEVTQQRPVRLKPIRPTPIEPAEAVEQPAADESAPEEPTVELLTPEPVPEQPISPPAPARLVPLRSPKPADKSSSPALRRNVRNTHTKTTASDLPSDLLELIFSTLPPVSLAAASGVCRVWRSVANRPALWHTHLAKRGIQTITGDFIKIKCTDGVKQKFRKRHTLERRFRSAKYNRHDLHKHTWTVERVRLVDHSVYGKVIVTGGWDGQVFAWRLKNLGAGRNKTSAWWSTFQSFLMGKQSGGSGAWVSALDATETRVAAGDTNGKVWVWSYDSQTREHNWNHGASITTVRFLPTPSGPSQSSKSSIDELSQTNSALLASASMGGSVNIWSVTKGEHLVTLKGHSDVVWHVRYFSPLSDDDSIFLLTAGRDGVVKTWQVPIIDELNDRSTPLELTTPTSTLRAHDDAILALAVWDLSEAVDCTRDSKKRNSKVSKNNSPLLATCGADDVVVVWRVIDGSKVSTLTGHKHGILCATFVEWSEGGGGGEGSTSRNTTTLTTHTNKNPLRLVTGSADKTVRVWCVFSGSCLGVIDDHNAPVTCVKARPDGLVTLAPGDGVMAYWRPVDQTGDEQINEGDSDSTRDLTQKTSLLPSNLRASMTLMDGAGSGFSACLAMDLDVLAVGTKTGAVQVLDFRRNAT